MTRTVVDVNVAVPPRKSWHTGTFIVGFSLLDAGASIQAGRRVTGKVTALAVLPCVLRGTLASVAADLVDALSTVFTTRRVAVALVDVLFAGLSEEERSACADEGGINGRAMPAVGTRIRGTRVGCCTVFT